MSIALGIDIGSDKCVVAFVNRNGVVEVLQNEASKREIPVVVHFDETESLFGYAAAARAIIDPKSTVYQLKRLIGLRFDDPSFQKVRALLPYKTPRAPNGDVLVKMRYMNEERKFTAVELLGMFLCYLKRMAEKATESTISECVIGIPSYFTDQQRRDYILAAEVAGLKPLRLFHDGAATALDYGIYRNLPYGEEINVVFVDIGHGDTQVTVVKFYFGAATVLAHSFDRDLGGRDFDDVIFESFAEKFEQQYHLNVRENPKATFRLRTACEKAKKVLGSNPEAQINIECFVGDNDLVGVITRTEFENLSSGLLKRIIASCKRALADTDLIKKEIHSVELVGSGSRIPKIADVLRDFFGRETSRTLNGSECIANGCALQCAMLNGAPGGGIFGVHDRMPFSVVGSSACMNSSTPTSIIHKGNFLLSPRMLTLCPSESVTISYANLNDLPDGVSPDIMCYKVACENATDKYNLEIRVQFSIHGTIDVKSASLKPIAEALVPPESLNSSEKASQNFNFLVEESGKAREFVHSSETKVEGDKFDATAPICRDFSKQLLDVKISEVPNLETCAQKVLEKAKKLESTLTEQDKAIERAKNRRNDLEAYMYQARDRLSRGFGNLASKSHRDDVTNMLNLTGVWLDETGTEEPETTYTKKMGELQLALRHLQEEHLNIRKENEKKANFITYTNKKMDALASKFKECLGDEDKCKLNTMRHDIKSFVEGDGIIPEEEYRKRSRGVDRLLGQIEGRCIEELSRSRQTGYLDWIANTIFGKSPMPAAPTILVGNAEQNSQEISSPKRGLQSDPGGNNSNGEKKTEKMWQGESFNVNPSGSGKSQEAPNNPHGGMPTKPKHQSSSKMEDKSRSQHQGYTHLTSRANPTKHVSVIKKGDYIVIRGRPCLVVGVSANKAGNKQGRTVRGLDIITQELFEETVPNTHCCDTVCFTDCLLYQMSDNGDAIFQADSGDCLGPLKLSIPLIAEIAAKREEGLVLRALIMSWLTEKTICKFKFVPRR